MVMAADNDTLALDSIVHIREYSSPISGEIIYGDSSVLAELLKDIFKERRFRENTGVILKSYSKFINLRCVPGHGQYVENIHFHDLCETGKGAFGTVVKYVDKVSKEEFVMKILQSQKLVDEKSKDYMSLQREVGSLLSLNHDKIIKLIGLIKCHGAVCVMLENGGLSLEKYLSQSGRIIPDESVILGWLDQLLDAAMHIHSNNVIHCDIHLGNILLHDNQIKLCDFGSAKPVGNDLFTYSHGHTPAYFPPTVLRHWIENKTIRVSPRLDTFAIGKVLLEVVIFELISVKHMRPHIDEKRLWDDFIKQRIPPGTCETIRLLITGLMSYTTKDGISLLEAKEIARKYTDHGFNN